MNLVHGEIVELLSGTVPRTAKIRVAKALKIISVDLLTDPQPGDKVLVCEGIAIGKIEEPATKE